MDDQTASRHADHEPAGSTPLPQELPPVTPPSAGYIVQLFLIPALIVAAVVAVWALFGKLADSETDWKQLVSELGSNNEHRRWRAAMGLAQLLQNDQISPPEGQIPLNEQPVVVEGLTQLLKASLSSGQTDDQEIKHQEFLCRTLGTLNADEQVLPVLVTAMSAVHPVGQPDGDSRLVVKSALMSVALIAGRRFEQATGYAPADAKTRLNPVGANPSAADETTAVRGLVRKPLSSPVIEDPSLQNALKAAAQDSDPVVRHLAAFALASVSGPESIEILRVMLSDGDRNARANAAIGLARNGYPEALPTIVELLDEAADPIDPESLSRLAPAEQRRVRSHHEVEQPVIVRNCLRAVLELWPAVDTENRSRLQATIRRLEAEHFAPDVRIQAGEFLRQMEQGTPSDP